MDFPENKLLPAYSIVERHFYLMVLQCESCGKGPFEFVSKERGPDEKVDIWYVRCKNCNQGKRLLFDRTSLLIEKEEFTKDELLAVNPSKSPSRLIDVGQWLAIFYAIISAASQEGDRKEVQRLGYEATLALEEAIKFYQSDNDLPPENSIWTESSQKRFREHPEMFERHRILAMRDKLPTLKVIKNSIEAGGKEKSQRKERWWKRWFKK